MRVAIADEHQHPLHEELIAAVVAGATEAGITIERLGNPAQESRFDVLLLLGHPHFYPSFVAARKGTRRICWYGENLPRNPPTAAQRVVRALPSARLLDLVHDTAGRVAGANARDRIMRWREDAAVERELGRNVRELRRARGALDELVVVSGNRRGGAALIGWTTRTVPFGYHRQMCGTLTPADSGTRDIDVLFLGRDVHARGRRARWLESFREQLGRGPNLVVVEGGVYGADRHALLARTRVVVDIHRVPFNSTGMRFLIATAGGAALVNEASEDDWLPRRDEHVIEVPRPQLAGAVTALLSDEPRRRVLVDASQELLRTELAMSSCVRRVIEPGVIEPGA